MFLRYLNLSKSFTEGDEDMDSDALNHLSNNIISTSLH